jgi:hypothetical protein
MALEPYEVYVNPEAIIEINRGPHMTTVQAFGVDWSAAPAIHMHAQSFSAIAAPALSSMPAMNEPVSGFRIQQPPYKPSSNRNLFILAVATLVCAGIAAMLWRW